MKIVSLIPVKLNNQRLTPKNSLPLSGRSTCKYMFDAIKEKYVYCTDEAIKTHK